MGDLKEASREKTGEDSPLQDLRQSLVSKSELPPHVPIVVVGLKRQIQPVVRGEITYQMAELHDPLVGQPCLPQLRNVLVRDGGGILVDFNANSTSVRSRSSGTAFAPSATNCLTLPSSVFKPWFRIVQKAAVQYGQPLALDTAIPTCWISSMLSSPICQRTLVAPSFALKKLPPSA